MKEDLKIVVRDNVVRLMGYSSHEDAGATSKLISLGFGNGTAQAILHATRNLGLGVLSDLAAALSVEPWQLVFPGLDPDNLPRGEPYAFRWPFARIDPVAVLSLSGTAAQGVENGLLASLATIGIQPRPASAAGLLDRAIGQPIADRPPGARAITAEAPPASTPHSAPVAPRKRTAKAPKGS